MTDRTKRWIAAVLGVPYVAAASLLLLWPNGEMVRRVLLKVYLYGLNDVGIPVTITPEDYATLANALLFLPLTLLGILLLGRRRAWLVAVLGIGSGFLIEFLQAHLGLARVVELSDALLNAGGAVAGAIVGAVLLTLFEGRRRPEQSGSPD
ncbi:MAG: VanZ family protein [Dermatophilaceae bacterium]